MVADAPAPFYRGGCDDLIAEWANGALANRDYLEMMADGPWGSVVTHQVSDRIHCITGYSVANCTFVAGDCGLIMIDTGHNVGCGNDLLAIKADFSARPISALIYSHHHYTGGAAAILAAHPGIEIHAHPDVARNTPVFYAPRTLGRGMKQIGAGLPECGPDATVNFGFRVPRFEDPMLNDVGYVPPTQTVRDGEAIVIDGLTVVFHHTAADADDSLITHFPDLDLVHHNAALMPVMFPLYTLRGDAYRDPERLIAGLDRIREIAPANLIGCHGLPILGREAVRAFVTLHRDAYAYLYQQAQRAIERGLTPDELVAEVDLPATLKVQATLFPAYVDTEHVLRGFFRGLVGWWASDGAELHPPAQAEFGAMIVEGFGGVDNVLAAADTAIRDKKYNLAAKLLSQLIAAEPACREAKMMKAVVLRRMAYTTPTGIQTRNFLLAEVQALEGEAVASGVLPPRLLLGRDALLRIPLEQALSVFSTAFDPVAAPGLTATLLLIFTDQDRRFAVEVRHGAVEVHEGDPVGGIAFTLTLDRCGWTDILIRRMTLDQALDDGSVHAGVTDRSSMIQLVAGFHDLWGRGA